MRWFIVTVLLAILLTIPVAGCAPRPGCDNGALDKGGWTPPPECFEP